jgi:hypothetical protein
MLMATLSRSLMMFMTDIWREGKLLTLLSLNRFLDDRELKFIIIMRSSSLFSWIEFKAV